MSLLKFRRTNLIDSVDFKTISSKLKKMMADYTTLLSADSRKLYKFSQQFKDYNHKSITYDFLSNYQRNFNSLTIENWFHWMDVFYNNSQKMSLGQILLKYRAVQDDKFSLENQLRRGELFYSGSMVDYLWYSIISYLNKIYQTVSWDTLFDIAYQQQRLTNDDEEITCFCENIIQFFIPSFTYLFNPIFISRSLYIHSVVDKLGKSKITINRECIEFLAKIEGPIIFDNIKFKFFEFASEEYNFLVLKYQENKLVSVNSITQSLEFLRIPRVLFNIILDYDC